MKYIAKYPFLFSFLILFLPAKSLGSTESLKTTNYTIERWELGNLFAIKTQKVLNEFHDKIISHSFKEYIGKKSVSIGKFLFTEVNMRYDLEYIFFKPALETIRVLYPISFRYFATFAWESTKIYIPLSGLANIQAETEALDVTLHLSRDAQNNIILQPEFSIVFLPTNIWFTGWLYKLVYLVTPTFVEDFGNLLREYIDSLREELSWLIKPIIMESYEGLFAPHMEGILYYPIFLKTINLNIDKPYISTEEEGIKASFTTSMTDMHIVDSDSKGNSSHFKSQNILPRHLSSGHKIGRKFSNLNSDGLREYRFPINLISEIMSKVWSWYDFEFIDAQLPLSLTNRLDIYTIARIIPDIFYDVPSPFDHKLVLVTMKVITTNTSSQSAETTFSQNNFTIKGLEFCTSFHINIVDEKRQLDPLSICIQGDYVFIPYLTEGTNTKLEDKINIRIINLQNPIITKVISTYTTIIQSAIQPIFTPFIEEVFIPKFGEQMLGEGFPIYYADLQKFSLSKYIFVTDNSVVIQITPNN